MSITNPDCPNRYCDFCDSDEATYAHYISIEELQDLKGRIPGLIDEAN